MGDNGFSNFKKPDPSPFRLFCEDTFLNVFGNSNASAPTGSGHTSQPATESAASDASESFCERCKGTKLVTLYGTYMGDADDQPCPDCSDSENN